MFIGQPYELEVFQQCRARWKLGRDNITPPELDSFTAAMRKTIIQMYSWVFDPYHHHMTYESTKERWDRNWWNVAMKEEQLDQREIFEKAAKGWIALEQYWGEIYLQEDARPVAIDFECDSEFNDVIYRVHYDLIMIDKDDRVIIKEIGRKKNEWKMYSSVITKLELVSLEQIIGKAPAEKIFIDLAPKSRKRGYMERHLKADKEYMRQARRTIGSISRDIARDIVYASPGDHCQKCTCRKDCWF